MTNKMDRRQFLGTAAQVSCGCVMAAGFMGCAALTKRPGQQEEPAAAEGETATEAAVVAAAYCGLYCAACPRYLASIEDPAKGCPGCNLGEVGYECAIKPCAVEKNINSCGECDQFPCEKTQKFHGSGRDMSLVAEKNCYRVREIGYSEWLEEQAKRWSCENCGSGFSFKDEECPSCKLDVYSLAEEAAAYREK
ncbi:MAG: DUF3795 domain-containing protein [Fidelibacterota bacterium]|nr:MAG: DUF3795 domain-containing protein [Candidatus Neomarinimicrobiota bacterium]